MKAARSQRAASEPFHTETRPNSPRGHIVRSIFEMAAFGSSGKGKGQPTKPKRTSQDRYSWHRCFHGDALLGVADLDDGERGVYITIIWQMYQRRAALPLDYAWLSRVNNISVQRLRARLASLEAKGRIVVDREAGMVFDERTVRELTAADRLKVTNADRGRVGADHRWQKEAPSLRLVASGDLPDVVDKVIQPTPQPTPQTPPQPPNKEGVCFGVSERNQSAESYVSDGEPITNNQKTPLPPKDRAQARRSPHGSGGAPRHGMSVEEWRADQLRRMGLASDDEGQAEPAAPARQRSKAADRTVTRK